MWKHIASTTTVDQTFNFSRVGDTLKDTAAVLFNIRPLLTLVVILIVAGLLSRGFTLVLRYLSKQLRRKSSLSKSRSAAARFRRFETWVVLSIAILKFVIFAFAIYLWWVLIHPSNGQPTALIGASAVVAIIIGGVVGPLLRDFSYGSSMMAEQWYGVGDLVTIEPFSDMRGVVDRITLRSTRIRGLNGEIIWIANQSIAAVRVARKGVSTIAIELFVTSVEGAKKLIDEVNNLLPTGSVLVAEKLTIVHTSEREGGIWHITAIGETAPAREWILQETAIELLKKLDENHKKQVLACDPVTRFADIDAEKSFELAVKNAKKKQRSFNYRRVLERKRTT